MPAAKDQFTECQSVVIRFAGDSGDGIQTVGEQFTDSSAFAGNDISTLPDFPAEIRAPAGTLAGVSGFQIQFGSTDILTPGDAPDALVAMNPAALKANLHDLVPEGLLVVNTDAFQESNLEKAGYEANPLDDPELEKKYQLLKINITELTKAALEESPLTPNNKARCKNFFALGFMYFVYDRPMEATERFIDRKFGAKNVELGEACKKVLQAGHNFGLTTEIARNRYQVAKAVAEPGKYRKISGNQALVLGLVAASQVAQRPLFYAGYPITPASPILEGLAALKHFNVKTVQAEDEIAAAGMALGASFAGQLAITATSGPGMCLKSEFIGLAVITELPLIICDIQRGGPSTGLPTKTEQGDLLQALFGRNGESPIPVVAASSSSDCFDTAIEAARIALRYSTPVILLSDLYTANGSEPWRIPDPSSLPNLAVPFASPSAEYQTYGRDPETLARQQAIPGQPGLEHRIGGLEKDTSGSVSYDAENHEIMSGLRAEKIERIARDLPPLQVQGERTGDVLMLGWGGTYGAIVSAGRNLRQEGYRVSSVHLRHLNPFPDDLGELLSGFKRVLIPELNRGQLELLIRARYLIDTASIHKVQGQPFTVKEIQEKALDLLRQP